MTPIRDAAALLSPEGAVGGWASAWAQGVGYLDGLDKWGSRQPVLLLAGPGHQLRRRPGIRPSRARLPGEDVVCVDGLAMTTLPRAVYEQMRLVEDLVEAVVVLDMGISTVTGHAHTTLDAVHGHVPEGGHSRNVRRVRAAMQLCTTRSASPSETRLRMVAVLEVRLANWLPNRPVFNSRGDLLGIAGLLDPVTGLVLEADGEAHLREGRRGRDNSRDDSMLDHNLTVVRITGIDYAARRVARRIVHGDQRARAGDRSRDRWTLRKPPWWSGHPLSARWG